VDTIQKTMAHPTLLTAHETNNAAAFHKKAPVHDDMTFGMGEDFPGQLVGERVLSSKARARETCFWASPRETCFVWGSARSREPINDFGQGSTRNQGKIDVSAEFQVACSGVPKIDAGTNVKSAVSCVSKDARKPSIKFASTPGIFREDAAGQIGDSQSARSQGWWASLFGPASWMQACWTPPVGIDVGAFEENARAQKNLLGSLVTKIVASYDASVLGVETGIGSMKLSPMQGSMEIWDLTVNNPEGYHSRHVLHARRAKIEIDMKKLLFSKGRDIVVQEIAFDGVNVIYEKALSTSNLSDLLERILLPRRERKANAEDLTLSLHKVSVKDIGLKLATVITGDAGAHIAVSDISYENFDQEIGEAGRCFTDSVRILMITFIKSVLAALFGKRVANHVIGTVSHVHNGISNRLIDGVRSCAI
jgi:hypothetical protein